ncbi:hypothetical protein [Modestobacter italicus]|uniref:hypothetical protein n=1 Tax=Modestobacter italicus (strain DSM 44449 / CECT 9708 / BC 501) TaxID=2732864 RepID=UPI001C943E1E|nr:hypothetical protein [Modestobacter italicus]
MMLRRLLLAVLATVAVAGCSSADEPAATRSPGTAEPTAADVAAAAAATADPAAAQDPAQAAVAVALRATDLPAGWSVQANPLPADADLTANPSLTGICGQTFASEQHRTSKQPVVGLDATGTPQLSSEAIAYDSPAAAGAAVQELVQAFGRCPEDQYTFETGPSAEGLAATSVVFQYRLADGTTQVVLAQARGQVLSVLIGEDPAVTAAAGRAIAARMAALPAEAIGA